MISAMELNAPSILLLCLLTSPLLLPYCDGRRSNAIVNGVRMFKYLDVVGQKLQHPDVDAVDSANTEPYLSSPFSLPPFDSLPPVSLPLNAPPYCIYPPTTPQPPSITIPTPFVYTPPPPPLYYHLPPLLPTQSPPPTPASIIFPTPPEISVPSPPEFSVPSPPEFSVPSPTPTTYFPAPPTVKLPPPSIISSPPYLPVPFPSPPTAFLPSPPVFEPPVVYPPPSVPPPPNAAPNIALWCVAKASVPDPIIQEAMNYACGSGADCDSILPDGFCFHPDTLFAHASFAFNSYWQRTKVAGGTCDFGGTAMLVTVDPSYDGCHFIYY